MSMYRICITLCLAGLVLTARAAEDPQATAALRALSAKVKAFAVVELPLTPGEVTLHTRQGLTVEALRGVQLDETPPVLRRPEVMYPREHRDDFLPGQAPYVARGILPFRFAWFTNEFNYGGWHNLDLHDYMSAHGCSVIYPYIRKIDDPKTVAHLPAGTQWLKWGGPNLEEFKRDRGIDNARLDRLMDLDLVKEFADFDLVKPSNTFNQLMVDIEYAPLRPETLRKQDWYPRDATETERAAFEKKYYDGYANSYAAFAHAARQHGWKTVSIYGWQPYHAWYGLEKADLDIATDWAWNAYGKTIYEAYDIINPDVYCFYRHRSNVAYTLGNIDLCMKAAKATAVRKPMRPYYWTLLHGGDADYHWWSNQPLLDEETRAMFAMAFFTGVDGVVLWNWSGTGNHHAPPPLMRKEGDREVPNDVMLKNGFALRAQGIKEEEPPTLFKRYDMLHILDVNDQTGLMRFQRIETPFFRNTPDQYHFNNYAFDEAKPIYAMPVDELRAHLRPASEPVAAMIEGLALVKPFEYLLRHGDVKIDVPAQQQFAHSLPVVRRVKLGPLHVLITYDPGVIFGAAPRTITLKDFDGHAGLHLSLPASAETRIFVLRENPEQK